MNVLNAIHSFFRNLYPILPTLAYTPAPGPTPDLMGSDHILGAHTDQRKLEALLTGYCGYPVSLAAVSKDLPRVFKPRGNKRDLMVSWRADGTYFVSVS